MKKKLILIIIVIGFSCSEKEQKSKIEESPSTSYFKQFNDESLRRDLSRKVFSEGDTLAYNKLWDMYFHSGHSNDFLRIAMVMSNDFGYSRAYSDTYIILKTDIINKANIKSNKIADYYLLKAYELNPEKTNSLMKERFGEDFPKIKADDYWKLINQ